MSAPPPPPPPPPGPGMAYVRGAWRPLAEVAVGPAAPAAAPVPSLTVTQFRDRWRWRARVLFEAVAGGDVPPPAPDADPLTAAEMRAINKELEARAASGAGVDPRSARMARLGARVVAAGIITADDLAWIAAPVGAYAGEPGAPPGAPAPTPPDPPPGPPPAPA